ncbi:MAG: hypothetical protein IPL79_06040 [Myxococcales bacterium]|nr:hypothetical protein [Myxococcales bacterium]
MIKHIKISPFSYLILSAAISVAGCNNDGDGIDGSRTISSLTADEIVEMCESYQLSTTQIEGGKKLGCFINLLEAEACTEEALADCVADSDVELETCEPPTAGELADFADCEATVAQMQACQNGYGDILEDVASFTCADAESEGLDLSQPAACAVVAELCPELFGDDAPAE